MELSLILYPVAAISGLGLLFGLGLGYAGKIFAVKEDERVTKVREALPGANCGGCGYAGCDAFANAVVAGEAKTNGCPVGGEKSAVDIAEIMGVKPVVEVKKVAFNRCKGGQSTTLFRYNYFGMDDCRAVQMLAGGGSKACTYGCLGNGSCIRACQFGAISLVDGIAKIDDNKCTACGMCVNTCPRNLIELVPYESKVRVVCQSHDNGKTVRSLCSVGCIACKMCEKACAYDAIHVENNLAKVDYEKCVQCGACVAKCPTKVISGLVTVAAQKEGGEKEE